MGNFYVNHTVRTEDQKRVVEVLRQAGRTAVVGPAENGYVVVFDEGSDSQDDGQIVRVGQLLSRDLAAPVLAVLNHDDDILCYWLFEAGRQTDHYNSAPDYFDDEGDGDQGGDAERLCTALGVPDAAAEVEDVLRDEDGAFAVERHQRLTEALGLPEYSVGAGYRYVSEDDAEVDPDECVRVP